MFQFWVDILQRTHLQISILHGRNIQCAQGGWFVLVNKSQNKSRGTRWQIRGIMLFPGIMLGSVFPKVFSGYDFNLHILLCSNCSYLLVGPLQKGYVIHIFSNNQDHKVIFCIKYLSWVRYFIVQLQCMGKWRYCRWYCQDPYMESSSTSASYKVPWNNSNRTRVIEGTYVGSIGRLSRILFSLTR